MTCECHRAARSTLTNLFHVRSFFFFFSLVYRTGAIKCLKYFIIIKFVSISSAYTQFTFPRDGIKCVCAGSEKKSTGYQFFFFTFIVLVNIIFVFIKSFQECLWRFLVRIIIDCVFQSRSNCDAVANVNLLSEPSRFFFWTVES